MEWDHVEANRWVSADRRFGVSWDLDEDLDIPLWNAVEIGTDWRVVSMSRDIAMRCADRHADRFPKPGAVAMLGSVSLLPPHDSRGRFRKLAKR